MARRAPTPSKCSGERRRRSIGLRRAALQSRAPIGRRMTVSTDEMTTVLPCTHVSMSQARRTWRTSVRCPKLVAVSEASPITCFACDREPIQQCARCGRPYCEEHGEELCDICMQPATGVPSFSLYRGSLLALLVGTALAVWLLVQPTSSSGDTQSRLRVVTPTAAVGAVQPGSTPAPGTTPGANSTQTAGTGTATRPAGTGTPGATGTPGVAGTPSANTYTVVAGDTLSGICSVRRPGVADCVETVRTLNSLTSDSLSVGQTLRLP